MSKIEVAVEAARKAAKARAAVSVSSKRHAEALGAVRDDEKSA